MTKLEKVIKGLENHNGIICAYEKEPHCPYFGEGDCIMKLCRDALELPKSRKWISVKDRLPDESEEYLVFSKRGYRSVLDYSTRHKEFNAKDTDKKPLHAIEVTHWMPLPEPPKEEP